MSESKFQYLHFYNVGLTNSKLVVLVSRHAQSGSGKRQDFTRAVGTTVNVAHIDLYPLRPSPLNPQFHISNPDSLVLGPIQHYHLLRICPMVNTLGWVRTLSLGKWTL